jgi:hypothetical protein
VAGTGDDAEARCVSEWKPYVAFSLPKSYATSPLDSIRLDALAAFSADQNRESVQSLRIVGPALTAAGRVASVRLSHMLTAC